MNAGAFGCEPLVIDADVCTCEIAVEVNVERRRMARKVIGILAVSGCAAIGAPAWAHHSMAAYEPKEETTYEGVVTEVRWTTPHMFVYLDVTTADGKTENWAFEGGAVTALVNSGVSPRLLKPGAKVKISGRRHLDSTKHMAILRGVEIDGKVYGRNSQTDRPRVAEQ